MVTEAPGGPDEAHKQALAKELRILCRGRGLDSPGLDEMIGPVLASVSGITELADGAAVGAYRARLVQWLTPGLAGLPDDLALVARAALGVHPGARQRFLNERLRWSAERLGREERTIRRRLSEALSLLADAAVGAGARTGGAEAREGARGTGGSGPGPGGRVALGGPAPAVAAEAPAGQPAPAGTGGTDWYYERLRALVRFDRPEMEVIHEIRVVALVDALDRVVVPVSLPRPVPNRVASRRDLLADIMYGGRLERVEKPSESLFHFVVRLPRALAVGERHVFAIALRPPPGQPMSPHYGFTPLTRCDEFQMRVRFDPCRAPRGLWRLDGLPPRILDDEPSRLPAVALDSVGEAEAHFHRLAQGRAYGIRWRE